MSQETDQQASPSPLVLGVVGIGASAGGIAALESLLPLLPANSGLAYIIVQHLDPDHDSALTSILTRNASLPVFEAADGMPISANHIFVAPPNRTLAIVEDQLLLAPVSQRGGQRAPIDAFLQSLALAKGENAACVILSGAGSDGVLGLRAVKGQGGLTLAQRDAQYDGMMRSAVRTGMVDFVLPLEEVPAKLQDYFSHLGATGSRKGPDGLRDKAADNLAEIASLLRACTGHDFSGYKDKTLARRVQRRMQVLQIDEVRDFVDHLRGDPQEANLLLQDLLIGVTNFFRDRPAFEALEKEVIPKLFEGKGPEDMVRVWVPGCSTGEEAYSIAILLRERMPQGRAVPQVQIFASDIDEEALRIARIGRFPATVARDISSERLARHFVRENGNYLIARELRETCLFSAHNLLRDAPFSKLDLISCRNLLIYLTPELQDRLIPLFHYALNDSGFLFLGTSENVTRHSRLFSTVDKIHRIFRRRSVHGRRLPEFPLTAVDGGRRRVASVERPSTQQEPLQALAERQLLDRYAPPFVVINAEGDLLHGSGRTGKYLELSPGVPRMDVFAMARQGLRPDLRATVRRAATSDSVAIQRNVVVGTNGGRQTIDLIVHPLKPSSAAEPLFMVVFQDVGGIKGEPDAPEMAEELESASLRQLELELRATRERLQATTEELESSNEELKSGNEELSSMNEELQSANEELETSREELQSINEELQIVNAELNARVEELSRANSDIANLLESTQIATVFLDRDLAIKSFTPAAKDLFRLVESDVGRPITHVRARFHADTVQEDAERVLRSLATIERPIESGYNASRYIMRMVPYRTIDNVIGGVVLTFVDVTKSLADDARINELTAALRDRVESLESLLDLLPLGVIIQEDNGTEEVRLNRHGARLLGVSGERGLVPRRIAVRLFDGEREIPRAQQPLHRAAHSGEPVAAFEGWVLRPDGSRADVMMQAVPLFGESGRVRGGIVAMIDISERKRAEAHKQALLYELQHRVKNVLATITALATRMLRNAKSPELFGQAFLGRLHAMAATHELLSRVNWTGADLRELIEATLRGHDPSGGSIELSGPRIFVTPAAASTLGLVFYELVTNAAKYGALASPAGRIEATWRLAGSDHIELVWTEVCEPARPAVLGEGFGTGFVRRSIEYEMEGRAVVEPTPSGLRWTVILPSKGNIQQQ